MVDHLTAQVCTMDSDCPAGYKCICPSPPPPPPPVPLPPYTTPTAVVRRLGELPAKAASAYDDLDIQTQTEAEAKAEVDELEALAGPFARPRGRRLLFGGLNSGVGGTGGAGGGTGPSSPTAFDNNACYCQMMDYNVPVKDTRIG